MTNCAFSEFGSTCDAEASCQVQASGTPTAQPLCMAHAEIVKQRFGQLLVPYTFTSLVKTDPTEKELLADSYGMLQDVHTQNEGLRKAVARLERELNQTDQERQRLGVDLLRKTALVEELSTQLVGKDSQLSDFRDVELAEAHELLTANGIPLPQHERVEGSEVKPLSGVDADTDPDSPTAKLQGGQPPAER